MHIRARMRYGKLIAVGLVHAALVMSWRRPTLPEPVQAQRESQLFLLEPRQMNRQTEPDQPPALPGKARTRGNITVPPAAPAMIAVPAAQSSVDAAAPAETADSALALPEAPAPAPTLLDNSRKLVAGIDKQLRKESRNEKDRAAPHEPKLATGIAAAYRERTFHTADTRMPNGDVITKVRTAFGTYCVRTNGNRNVGLRDPFTDTGKQSLITCPF